VGPLQLVSGFSITVYADMLNIHRPIILDYSCDQPNDYIIQRSCQSKLQVVHGDKLKTFPNIIYRPMYNMQPNFSLMCYAFYPDKDGSNQAQL